MRSKNHMTHWIDDVRGPNKPIDLFKFLVKGEYDQGDTALVAYDDVYDLLHDEVRRQSLKEAINSYYGKS